MARSLFTISRPKIKTPIETTTPARVRHPGREMAGPKSRRIVKKPRRHRTKNDSTLRLPMKASRIIERKAQAPDKRTIRWLKISNWYTSRYWSLPIFSG
jgi:hypothetical protein